ncbi:MAG: hypothetical protein HYW85_05820, partial [Deltaproteobacteria bacterium]|nr:hypothetical protein [Deltaproteobacteria bacterium]
MTTKLLLGSILGVGLSICAQAQDIVIQDSDHFLVVYQKGNVSKNLAKKFLKTLEYGRSQILKWEFQEPSFMKKEKLSIYLIPQEKRKNKNSLGTFYGVQDPFIEITIAKKFSLQDYKSTLFHELFHAFQHGYVEWKHKWFAEATADAVMDELLISQKEIPHYISANDRYEFMFFWDLYSFDSLEGLHEYTSSIFFSYLIHEFKAGIDSIKKLWEEKPSSKDNTFTLLQKILGGEKQFQEILHQFSVALITGSSGKSPFGFSKPSLPILPLIDRIIVAPRIKDEKGYIKHFDSLTGSLSPKSLRLAPYSTKYVRLLSKNTEGIQDSLYLALPQNNTFSHAVLLPTENKTILYAFEKDRLEIPYFSNRGGPQEAILVVTNSTAQKIETPLTAAFSPPPHVARVKITDVQKKKVIYDTFWNSTSQNNRTFEEILNKADTDKRKKILLSFEVLFSRKVSQARLILPAISSSPLQELRNEGASGYTYRTKKSVWVEVLPATQEIPFY